MTKDLFDIVVIGAGIVGVSIALELQSQGRNPLLVDRKGVASEASRGNAGAFAFSEVEPIATPGIMRNAPKWLLDPMGPLSIPPAYAFQIAPWLLRFWRSSWQDRYTRSVSAQTDLMQHSRAAFERQLKRFSNPAMIRREGQLELYQGAATFQLARSKWQRRTDLGIKVELLESPNQIAEIQPGLSKTFTHAGYTPDWANTTDPRIWTESLASRFIAKGGAIETRSIQEISVAEDHIVIRSDRGTFRAKQIVISAGAWSHKLAEFLGDTIPLETERGYNTTFTSTSIDLRTHLSFSAHGFVMSKIGDGVRIGGAVELGGLKLPPNYRRAETLVKKAKSFVPQLEIKNGAQWMGFRPSLPDSLPVISRSKTSERVLYAFGHGHLGLTQSAGTAELIAALAANRKPVISLAPFAATRF